MCTALLFHYAVFPCKEQPMFQSSTGLLLLHLVQRSTFLFQQIGSSFLLIYYLIRTNRYIKDLKVMFASYAFAKNNETILLTLFETSFFELQKHGEWEFLPPLPSPPSPPG